MDIDYNTGWQDDGVGKRRKMMVSIPTIMVYLGGVVCGLVLAMLIIMCKN